MSGDDMIIPDLKERELALDPTKSFIVEAPAGSGKTELLIRRYLRLLSTVDRPEDILAITFTRKAAGEMHSRVMDSLAFAAKGEAPEEPYRLQTYELSRAALARDSELKWGILENPSRLRVQTIDSLSAEIVTRMPVLTRLGGTPRLIEEPEEIYEEAARRVIEKVEEDSRVGESVREALGHLDNFVPNLKKRLVTMLRKRDQWLRHTGAGVSPRDDRYLKERLEAPVKAIVEESLDRIVPLIDEATSAQIIKSARFAASVLLNNSKHGPVTKLADLEALPGSRAENIDMWRSVAAFLMTKDGAWRSPTGVNIKSGFPKEKEYKGEKDDFKALLDEFSGRDDLREALGVLSILPNFRYDEQEWSILVALLHLLPVAAVELETIFASDGFLDFQALTMAASRALGSGEEPEELLLSMDSSLEHLLVDEFQDTSKSHYKLIESLVSGFTEGDGRTLFIVGDPMQSIYLFRDADVGLFLKAASGSVANIELNRLKLTTNFRSQPAIVEWVNATFALAFPEAEDISSGSVRYTDSHAALCGTQDEAPSINIYASRDNELEARDIADRVELIRLENPSDESVAILVRSRTHLSEIIDELKARDIDFRTTNLDPLIESAVVRDLMSLTRALKHPFDRVAWLAILRAPWCGLSLMDIHRLTHSSLSAPIYQLICGSESGVKLSPAEQVRLAAIEELITRATALSGTVSDRALIESLWVELGGPACLEDDSEMDNALAFFELVGQFSDTGVPFSLEALEARVKKLFASHSGLTDNPLEIMTIHKAKGLEFDHVILPGLGKSAAADKKELLTWIEKDGDMLLAPVEGMEIKERKSLYSYIRLLKTKKSSLEQTRLFYVAATRARRTLSLYAHAKKIEEPEDGEGVARVKVNSDSLLNVIEASLDISSLREVDDRRLEGSAKPSGERGIKLRRLAPSWRSPEPAPALKRREFALLPDMVEAREATPTFDWASEERKHLGTVLHRYFCRIVTGGIENWDFARVEAEEGAMQAMLRGLGLSNVKAAAGAKDSVKTLIKALGDKQGRFVLSRHKDDEAEYQLTGIVDGVIKDVKIDRTFVDSDDVRWIVDYKTGSHKGDVESFLENEKQRYSGQLNKYKEIFSSLDAGREIKCALYYPALGRLVEL